MQHFDPPILEYAAPVGPDDAVFWRAMRFWRTVAGTCLLLLPFAFGVHAIAGLLALAALTVGTIVALTYMTRAAARELGPAYAARHLILAVLLLPLLLLGLFLISRLIEADVARLHLAASEGSEDADRLEDET